MICPVCGERARAVTSELVARKGCGTGRARNVKFVGDVRKEDRVRLWYHHERISHMRVERVVGAEMKAAS